MTSELLTYLSQFVTGHKLALFERNLRERTRHLAVVLEDLYQPHNASACLRSCDAFGVQDVHIIENANSFRVNPDISLGSAQWLTLKRHRGPESTRRCLDELRSAGYRVVATVPRGEAVPLHEFDVAQPAALFFGNELEGLSDAAIALADQRLQIPTFGFAESLNISVCVAVCLQHLTLKLRSAAVDWRLSEEESRRIKLEWVRRAVGSRLPILEREFHRRSNNRKSAGTLVGYRAAASTRRAD